MLETIKDNDGKVVAYCEWNLVDKKGHTDSQGKYVFVRDMWIHETIKGVKSIRDFIDMIGLRAPSAAWVYWERKKYGGRIKMVKRREMKESNRGFN